MRIHRKMRWKAYDVKTLETYVLVCYTEAVNIDL